MKGLAILLLIDILRNEEILLILQADYIQNLVGLQIAGTNMAFCMFCRFEWPVEEYD